MTTLTITPNWKNKTAKFRGTIAAGEHVAVSIANDDGTGNHEYIEDATNLRLRVVDPTNGKTLAQFPMPPATEDGEPQDNEEVLPTVALEEAGDEWDSDLTPLACTLNLNTVQMLKAVPPGGGERELLFVLDAYAPDAQTPEFTLYFKDLYGVAHWPRRTGEDEPVNLDDYKDLIADLTDQVSELGTDVATAKQDAAGALAAAQAAQTTAAGKADKSDTYTKLQTDDKIADAIGALRDSAPEAFDTLKEIADWIQDDQSGAAALAGTVASHTTQIASLSSAKADQTITVTPAHGLPADCYPVVYVKDGTTHTITSNADIRDAAPRHYVLYGESDTLLCLFNKSDGTISAVSTDLTSLTFNGTAPTQDTWPVLTSAAVTSDVVYDKDIIAPSTASSASGKAADAKATGDALAGKLGNSGDQVIGYGNQEIKFGFDADRPFIAFKDDNERTVYAYQPSASGTLALAAANPTAGNFAALDASGNPVDSGVAKSDVESLFFAQYYPEGNVKSAAEFTSGIKYDAPDTTNRTITVKPFCDTGTAADDNSSLVGRVVIPPFVDAQGNGYISDDGTRFKVVGVNGGVDNGANENLTSIIAPTTVTDIGFNAFAVCTSLASVSLPSATTIGVSAFVACSLLTSISLPAATAVEYGVFAGCASLTTLELPSATSIGEEALFECFSLTTVDFGNTPRPSVPSFGRDAFVSVPSTCKIIVPDGQYAAWVAAPDWSDLVTAGYKFLRHSEWEYARKYEVDKKADKPATFTTGNLAALDSNGNPTDSTIPASNIAVKDNIPYNLVTKSISNGAVALDDRASNAVAISATLSPNTLTINFPTATSGKVRDFALRLDIASGVTAPELAWPQGVTLENDGGEVPEIADGGTGGSSTILYFSETENDGTTAKFIVKGETLTAIAQA